jgi:O-methyltransferase
MNTVVILGAGQMGYGAATLLNGSEYRLLAFGDNDPKRWNPNGNPPVMSISDALQMQSEWALIAVSDSKRGMELEKQTHTLGYRGKVIRLDRLMSAVDIRSAETRQIAKRLEDAKIPGAVAELGVYRGELAQVLNGIFPSRKLFLFDTFEGFSECDLKAETNSAVKRADFTATSVETVLGKMPHPKQIRLMVGHFPETAADLNETFAFVSMDADLRSDFGGTAVVLAKDSRRRCDFAA